MTEIVIDATELEGAARKLELVTKGDLRDLMERVGDALVDVTDRHFDEKKDPDGANWERWSESYRKSGRGVALLDRTGEMRRGLRRGRTGGRSVRVGFAADYAPYHVHGTRRMPRRSPLGFGDDEMIAAEAIAVDWIERLLVG